MHWMARAGEEAQCRGNGRGRAASQPHTSGCQPPQLPTTPTACQVAGYLKHQSDVKSRRKAQGKIAELEDAAQIQLSLQEAVRPAYCVLLHA